MTQRGRQTVSVVVPAWNSERRQELATCLRAIEAQTRPPDEVIAVIDHNDELLDWTEAEFPEVRAIPNAHAKGVVGARNTGVEAAGGGIVVLTDDDTRAAPDWLEQLEACFTREDVVGVTGELLPNWQGSEARWFPFEFYWVFGCSYAGLPETLAPVRNPIAANMAVRRWAVQEIGGFRQGVKPQQISHRGAVVAGGHALEDTELGIRIGRRWPQMKWLYQPNATVMHTVNEEQATLGYLLKRSFEEGAGKAALARAMGPDGLESERRHLLVVIPKGIARGFADLLRGDARGPLRSLAILAGITAAALGYLNALLADRLHPRGRRQTPKAAGGLDSSGESRS
jgi:cellulose synthase/poly-beta-1,6-N-acetylglucosamine synthase-like glycosyltransferase